MGRMQAWRLQSAQIGTMGTFPSVHPSCARWGALLHFTHGPGVQSTLRFVMQLVEDKAGTCMRVVQRTRCAAP